MIEKQEDGSWQVEQEFQCDRDKETLGLTHDRGWQKLEHQEEARGVMKQTHRTEMEKQHREVLRNPEAVTVKKINKKKSESV